MMQYSVLKEQIVKAADAEYLETGKTRAGSIFRQVVTDLIKTKEFDSDDIPGLIGEAEVQIPTTGKVVVTGTGNVFSKDILDIDDIYPDPDSGNASSYKYIKTTREVIANMTNNASNEPTKREILFYRVGSTLKFYKKEYAGNEYVTIVYIEAPAETIVESFEMGGLYSIGFLNRAIQESVNRLKVEL